MRKYSHNRSERIADQIQKDVVAILRFKVKDPRIEWITINDVEVTEDNSVAKIYWTVLNESKRPDVEKALEMAKGFIRSELSKGFKTYTIPQLKFFYDESLARGSKILNILNEVKKDFSDETKN
ncbi:MAG: ribosome-binding factor [Burkholderiales bacterium]|jgi:ribosome-binding factor A|nr:ribosome-binding factor [Burkholderiales bacterium]